MSYCKVGLYVAQRQQSQPMRGLCPWGLAPSLLPEPLKAGCFKAYYKNRHEGQEESKLVGFKRGRSCHKDVNDSSRHWKS